MVEKSEKWTLFVGLLLIGVIISAGCIGDEPTEEGEASSATQPTTAETSTDTSSGGLLSDLLDKAKGTTSVKYDMVTASPGEPTETAKVWSKEGKMRMEMTTEEGQTMIMIINELEAYMYNPEENTAIKMDFNDLGDAPGSAVEDMQSLMDDDSTVVGVDTVDGKLCTVVESAYISEVLGESYEIETTSWVWQKHGVPIRTETTSSFGGEDTTTITEMKNIDFGNIPDNMFELPAGVKVMDLQSMMEEAMLPDDA